MLTWKSFSDRARGRPGSLGWNPERMLHRSLAPGTELRDTQRRHKIVDRLVRQQATALAAIAIAQLERRCRRGAYWAMALETINGTLQLTRLTNESAEYIARREELRLAEIELMRQRERVAAMRRRLPPGAVVQDYVFQEGPANLDAGDAPITTVRLSDLFTGPNRSGRDLSPDVRKAADQSLPDVHDVDRRLQRRQPPYRTERRLRDRRRRGSARCCDSTPAIVDGAICGCSVAATARSSTTFEARTRKAGRIQPFRSSLETATARCGIRIPHTHGWRTMSRSAASTC